MANVMFTGKFTVVVALPQLVAGVQPAPGAGGVVPPLGSTEAKFVMLPLVLGAVVVIVNVAAPFATPAAKAAVRFTVQLNVDAPKQFTVVTFVPGAVLTYVTPGGSTSATVSVVPLAVPPLLPRLIV